MRETNRNAPAAGRRERLGGIERSWRDPRRRPQRGLLIGAPIRGAIADGCCRSYCVVSGIDGVAGCKPPVEPGPGVTPALFSEALFSVEPLELLVAVAPVFGLTPLGDRSGGRFCSSSGR
jgi:hypothetical protein